VPTRPAAQGPTGVVFVHGIGSQPQSATVREFAQPLLDYLREWHRTRGFPTWQPDSAELSYGGTLEGPGRVALKVAAFTRPAAPGRPEMRWNESAFVFAEGWWATRLDAPSFPAMLGWSWSVLGKVIGTLIRQMLQRIYYLVWLRWHRPIAVSDPGVVASIVEVINAALVLAAYGAAAIAGYVVLIPLFVLAQIPIAEVQEFILVKLIRPFLVENVGDFETYVVDDVQALNVRSSLGTTIRELLALGCDDVCVLAHSQGAIVAFDAICALAVSDPAPAAHVRKLITVGGALNRGFALAPRCVRLQQTLPSHVFWLDIWSQYDPVAGGYLRRPKIPARMVNPSPAFRGDMHWSGTYDGPMPDQVTNGLNPLVDHGEYFHNAEQFASRILAEIDDPRGYYQDSRFFLPENQDRVHHRRSRMSTLAFWRIAAIASVGVTLRTLGRQQLADIGHRGAEQLVTLPGHDLLTAPGQFFDLVGGITNGLAAWLESHGFLISLISSLRAWWAEVPSWSDLVLAAAGLAAVFALLYGLLLWALYRRWDRREAVEAIAEVPPERRGRALLAFLRSVGVVASLGDAVLWATSL
jgi:hypothetical protein